MDLAHCGIKPMKEQTACLEVNNYDPCPPALTRKSKPCSPTVHDPSGEEPLETTIPLQTTGDYNPSTNHWRLQSLYKPLETTIPLQTTGDYNPSTDHWRLQPLYRPLETTTSLQTTGDYNLSTDHWRLQPLYRPLETTTPLQTTGDYNPSTNHWRLQPLYRPLETTTPLQTTGDYNLSTDHWRLQPLYKPLETTTSLQTTGDYNPSTDHWRLQPLYRPLETTTPLQTQSTVWRQTTIVRLRTGHCSLRAQTGIIDPALYDCKEAEQMVQDGSLWRQQRPLSWPQDETTTSKLCATEEDQSVPRRTIQLLAACETEGLRLMDRR